MPALLHCQTRLLGRDSLIKLAAERVPKLKYGYIIWMAADWFQLEFNPDFESASPYA